MNINKSVAKFFQKIYVTGVSLIKLLIFRRDLSPWRKIVSGSKSSSLAEKKIIKIIIIYSERTFNDTFAVLSIRTFVSVSTLQESVKELKKDGFACSCSHLLLCTEPFFKRLYRVPFIRGIGLSTESC